MTMQVTASPEAVGMSASSIHEAQALIEAAVGRTKLAGAVLIVARGDQLVLLASVGLRDREAGAAMEPDAIFRIAWMTKPIVSVATLMLVEAGSLRLDDQVGSYLPELADVQIFAGVENGQAILVAAERPMTISQLLTHTSGLVYGPLHPALAAAYDILGDEPSDLAELIRRLGARPLAHQPGAEWTYGWSHDVLGRLIEVVADQPLDEHLETRIFKPLGMVDTGFHVPPEDVGRVAVPYQPVNGALQPIVGAFPSVEGEARLSGGAGLFSTGLDYLRFCRMLLRGGELDGARLLSAHAVERMTRNQLAFATSALGEDGYGFGVGVSLADSPSTGKRAGTYWWSGRFDTQFWVDPATGLIVVYLEQTRPGNGHGQEFFALVSEAVNVPRVRNG